MDSPNALAPKELGASLLHEAVSSSKATALPKQPPIFKLPDELLVSIAQLCNPYIIPRLRLTHVCQHWRLVISSARSLWTYIHIEFDYVVDTSTFENFTSLLSVQLERAGTAPLDVTWRMHPFGITNSQLVKFFREKAPFSQWRSLRLTTYAATVYTPHISHPDDDELHIHPEDAFSNLESLELSGHTLNSMLETLIRTTTSKLNRFDNYAHDPPGELNAVYKDIMTRISELSIPAGYARNAVISLPPNIVTLRATNQVVHMFPHVQEYTIYRCIFEYSHQIDLRALTHFVVNHSVAIHEGCHVLLSSLRDFKVRTISMHDSAKIEAPSLQHLHIWRGLSVKPTTASLNDLDRATKRQGFLLSPSKFITIDYPMSPESLMRLMENSPDVEEVTLTFGDRNCAREIVGQFARLWSMPTGEFEHAPTRGVCPRLRKLKFNFEWNRYGAEDSAEDALLASWKWNASSITPEVYGSWKEHDATYVRFL